jgi:nicotinamide mononucleotide transporter
VKRFIKNELSNWNIFEIAWLAFASCSIIGLSLYWKDSWYGIVSALAGVICVILTGKGKLSAYIFGVINCILYGFISFKQGLYGETMLNILYYLPLQFYGFIVWNRNMNDTDNEVKRISMPNIERFKKLGLIILSTFIYGVFLKYIKDPMPYMDSFTTTAAVFAMWLSCRRYTEQWYLWVSINIVSVYIWWTRYSIGGDNIATLLMWIIFLINSIYGLIKWNRK